MRRADQPETRHFHDWLHMSGCRYAVHLSTSNDDLVRYYTPSQGALTDEVLSDFELAIDAAAKLKHTAIGLFRDISSVSAIAALLKRLGARERWECARVDAPCTPGAVHVGLTWITEAKERSSVMGMAPLPTMVVPRRAPFVALVVWGGGHENQNTPWNRIHPIGKVGVIDAPTKLTQSKDTKKRKETVAQVRELLALTHPAAGLDDLMAGLREVAFTLPEDVVRSHLPELVDA